MLLCVHTRYNLFAHSSCTSVFILIFINPQYTVLHILSHCTFYSLFYFIICSYFHFYSHLYLYIFSCVMFHCFIYFFALSGPVLTYISLLIIPCMILYVTNNKEPWTLNKLHISTAVETDIWSGIRCIYTATFKMHTSFYKINVLHICLKINEINVEKMQRYF